MDVLILATKACSHCENLRKELINLKIEHKVQYCEDEPELVSKHNIRHSPNLIVDEKVIFRNQPTEQELKQFFKL